MVIEALLMIIGGAVGYGYNRLKNRVKDQKHTKEVTELREGLSELRRKNLLYVGVNPLKCVDCEIEFTGPLIQPTADAPGGGCPKCGSVEFVTPAQDEGIIKEVSKRLAHKPISLTDMQNNIVIRDALIQRIKNIDIMADNDKVRNDLSTLYEMYLRTYDPEIVKTFAFAHSDTKIQRALDRVSCDFLSDLLDRMVRK